MSSRNPEVGIIMGSSSDLDVMKPAANMLDELQVGYELQIVSAHRTPREMMQYAATARERGLRIIIAGAGGSAHLPGMIASETTLPVIAVPVKRDNHDHEALWSNIKMPGGIPLATMPENGALNAALLAVRILTLHDTELLGRYETYVEGLREKVKEDNEKIATEGWQSLLKA